MSNTQRSTIRAPRTVSAILASAAMLSAINASAEPDDDMAAPSQDDTPAATPAPAAPAALAPASAEAHRPPQPVPPAGYPFTIRPRPPSAEPQGPVFSWDLLRFAIAFENRTTWLRDDAAKRLAGRERTSGVGVSLQADVLRPQPDLAVRLDLGWVGNSESSYQDGSSRSERLQTHLFSLGIALRYQVLPYLAPFARVSGGLGWQKVTVVDLHDRQYFAHGTVGAGLALRSPGLRLWQGARAPLLGFVGHIEGGYALASSSSFLLHSEVPGSSEKPIPTSEVRLGQAERSAPYLRVSLGLAFY